MQIAIPPQESKQHTKPSRGELFGTLWATKNIDLEVNKGKIRLSERIYRLFDSGDDADFELPVAFLRSNADETDRWWALVQGGSNGTAINDGLLFKTTGTSPLTGWTQDYDVVNNPNSPTAATSDMAIFGSSGGYDRLVVATDTNLSMLNSTWTASWWQGTLSGTALTTAKKHLLNQFLNLLLIANGNAIHTLDDSLVRVENRITLPDEYDIMWMANDGLRVYIGTRHIRGGIGLIFPWDGTSKTYDQPLSPDSDVSYAGGVDENGLMHTINGKGQLLAYDGNGFTEVAALPISDGRMRWINNQTDPMMVHHNGMRLVGNRIHILLSASPNATGNGDDLIENMLGGIWAYDKDIGFYHKYSLGQYDGATDNEWGAGVIWPVGALIETNPQQGKFLVGCNVYSDNESTTIKAIHTSQGGSSVTNRGYFVTPQIQSSEVRAFWKRLKLAFKKLENSTDRIVVKYRTSKDSTLYNTAGYIGGIAASWSDTDTITTTDSGASVVVADQELEILVGKGAGAIAHVSSVTEAGGTYTINLDEAIPSASGNLAFRVMNWTKLGEISSQTIDKQIYKIAKRTKWVQLKVELRGTATSPEIEELLLEFNISKR